MLALINGKLLLRSKTPPRFHENSRPAPYRDISSFIRTAAVDHHNILGKRNTAEAIGQTFLLIAGYYGHRERDFRQNSHETEAEIRFGEEYSLLKQNWCDIAKTSCLQVNPLNWLLILT
jgi:hypothetical protein